MNAKVIAALAALIAAISATVIVTSDDDGSGHKTRTITVVVGSKQASGDLQAPRPDPGTASGEVPAASELRDESPPGVTQDQLDTGDENQTKLEKLVGEPQPTGGSQNYSCRKDFSGHVYSSRNGARVTEFILHYTVSPNVTGWGDVYGVQDYFKRTRVGSATYILDFEGHCLQMTPTSEKPWTTGNANPISETVEIIATGRETRAQWLASPIFKKGVLAELVRDRLRARGLPLRFVDPAGCSYPPGYTDHDHVECGNSHTDVSPAFPFDVFQKQLTAQDDATKRLLAGRRSHRIVHAKIAKRCRGARRHSSGCRALFKRNGQLHAKYGSALE